MISTFRFLIAIWIGKITSNSSTFLRTGAGGTWPGHLALKIYPEVLKRLESHLKRGSILISGTNGKTTTTFLLKDIFTESDISVVSNPSGANLINGLTSAFISDANLLGQPNSEIGIFEVDEGNLPLALSTFTPEMIILLNLSRDQLDRYGEVDSTVEKWLKALVKLPKSVKIILKKDDPHLNQLAGSLISLGFSVSFFSKEEPSGFISPLSGDFNQLNTNAAVASVRLFNINDPMIRKGLKNFQPAFGRGEGISLSNNRTVKILLAKNPESYNQNLDFLRSLLPQSLSSVSAFPTILFILNDNIPDGRDVSWIYDIDFEKHRDWLFRCPIFVSGKREADFTLRLKYAGLPVPETTHRRSSNLKMIIREAVSTLRPNQNLYILPTYSAMLETRKILTGRKFV